MNAIVVVFPPYFDEVRRNLAKNGYFIIMHEATETKPTFYFEWGNGNAYVNSNIYGVRIPAPSLEYADDDEINISGMNGVTLTIRKGKTEEAV